MLITRALVWHLRILHQVMREFYESSPSRNASSSEPTVCADFEVMRQRLLDCLDSFTRFNTLSILYSVTGLSLCPLYSYLSWTYSTCMDQYELIVSRLFQNNINKRDFLICSVLVKKKEVSVTVMNMAFSILFKINSWKNKHPS